MSKAKIVLMTLGICGTVFAGTFLALKAYDWSKSNSTIFKSKQDSAQWLQNIKLDSAETNSADFRVAAKKILPSVVSIDTQVEGEDFFGQHVVQDAGAGSGVVISSDGYIVTNNHVVRVSMGLGREQIVDKVRVTFSDGTSTSARIIGTDPRSDLAVLKVDKQGLSPIALGDSNALEVGQWVIAVGNPLGFENTLSVGVVSNVGRPLPSGGDAVFIDGIQTDAAINPGNSGGALCDQDGQLVGINSSIASTTRANIGIGFAIPVRRMKQVVDDIIKFGYAKYGNLGVQMLRRKGILGLAEAREELKRRTASITDPPSEGAVIVAVQGGSVAASAGIKELDVVESINGKPVVDIEDFQKIMSPLRPGETVKLKLWSAGKSREVTVALADIGKASL